MADINSPLGYAAKIEALMKLPQSLCKQRGCCCKMATFKGGLSYEEMTVIAESQEGQEADQVREFLSLFQPYASQEEIAAFSPEFLERVRQVASQNGKNPDAVSVFSCRYLQPDNRCGVHEDRPQGCRQYPTVHPNTIFHPGCGFEAQSKQNWAQIAEILDLLGLDNTGRPKSI